MLSLSLDTMLKLSKTTSPQKLFPSECITLYENKHIRHTGHQKVNNLKNGEILRGSDYKKKTFFAAKIGGGG